MVRRCFRAVGLAVLVASVGTLGCGGGTAQVSGTVTYRGKAVTSGSVAFAAPDGSASYANIQPNGSYSASGIPAGKVTVAVSSPDPRKAPPSDVGGGGRGKAAPAPPKATQLPAGWVALPAKYAQPDQSGLSTTLKSGPNTYDINLE